MIALAKPDNVIAFPQQKSNEWYTPASIIEATRLVMGSIDLDPASSAIANQTVKATRYFTIRDNGLVQPWYGNVWLNPPFGRRLFDYNKSTIGMFVEKLFYEYRIGNVKQSVLLATGRTDAPWFKLIHGCPLCLVDHVVHFKRPKEEQTAKNPDGTHTHGTILVYLGMNEEQFIDVFSAFGPVYKRVSQPKSQPINLSLWEAQ